MLDAVGADEYQTWISDGKEGNFRYALFPDYKANRPPRPHHYDFIKEYLFSNWDARISFGMEADDALGINQQWSPDSVASGATVICSIDKDLLQIPGNHYNFVKKEYRTQTVEEANRSFYVSILVGDTTDNITGCWKIGPVKAAKALEGCSTEEEYLIKIIEVYLKQEKDGRTKEEILDHILLAARLLKIRTTEDEKLWHFPPSVLQAAQSLSYTPPKQVEPSPSTEPI